jgi:hypothetical protein
MLAASFSSTNGKRNGGEVRRRTDASRRVGVLVNLTPWLEADMRATFLFIVAAALAFTASVGWAQGIPAGSTWENQRGSTLRIISIDSSTGAVQGEYINQAAGFGCKVTPYTVTGWVDGDKIAFAVRWKNATADCKSLTSWTGYLEKGFLVTDWNLVHMDADLGRPTIMRGSDLFTKK